MLLPSRAPRGRPWRIDKLQRGTILPPKSRLPACALLPVGALLWFGLATAAASAHPHVFAHAISELVGDERGRLAAVRNVWMMDELFSATVMAQFDADADGTLDAAELREVGRTVADSIAEFSFYTFLRADDAAVTLAPPRTLGTDWRNGQLVIFFEMPLKEPLDLTLHGLDLVNFDETFYVAFERSDIGDLILTGLPEGCRTGLVVPDEDGPLPAWTQSLAGSAATAPSDGVDYAQALADRLTVDCRPADTAATGPR